MDAWRDVEVAAAEALDGPTEDELEAIRGASFTVEAVQEREAVTDHDMAAFVDVLAASAGPAGRWIHFGLTSSDVLDTALALQLRRAGEPRAGRRPRAGGRAGRAGPRARGHDLRRPHARRARRADHASASSSPASRWRRTATPSGWSGRSRRSSVGAISGAVGTYASLGPDFEARVLERLGLQREPVSTQVVPRDRHAELLSAIALAGAGLERFATEIRHLQRTEVREVEEPFRAGQKGSSAMPHKRNPITTERITGLARVLRGYAQTGLENVALWHERDISHSGAERVVLPDATILLDYMQHLAAAGRARHDRPHRPHAREPRDHERRAVLPAGAARARRVGHAARRRLPDRPAPRPAGLGHADAAAASCSTPRTASSSTSTPSSTTRTTSATCRLCSKDSRSYRRPEIRACEDRRTKRDIRDRHLRRPRGQHRPVPRHPGRDRGPVPYVEHDGRRVATVSVLDAHEVEPHGIEILDAALLGRDELLAAASAGARDRGRARAPGAAATRRRAGARAVRVPGRDRGRGPRGRDRADHRPGGVRRAPPPQDRRPAGGHPPGPGGRGRRDVAWRRR